MSIDPQLQTATKGFATLDELSTMKNHKNSSDDD